MVRLRDKGQPENGSDEQSKGVCVEELAVIPWSGLSGEKRSLDVDDEKQQKKQCTGERCELRLSLPPPLPDDGDEIFCGANFWSMTMKFLPNGLPILEGSKK